MKSIAKMDIMDLSSIIKYFVSELTLHCVCVQRWQYGSQLCVHKLICSTITKG